MKKFLPFPGATQSKKRMLKTVSITILILLSNLTLKAQTEIWQMQNYCVGLTAGNDTYNSYTMSDVHMMPDSTYIMYYTIPRLGGQQNCIRYATSTDAINWTPQDTCFCGSTDSTDRNFIMGGADVVPVNTGGYRMYVRCTEKTTPPNYHIRSAFSTDMINWTQEGICIELQQFGGVSNLVLAGHGTCFIDGNGNYTFIFGGNFASDPGGQNGPSDLKIAQSTDGLNWTNFQTLFTDYHDPIVIKKNGQYIMYAMYLANNMGRSTSLDGITWTPMDSVSFVDGSMNPMLQTPFVKIGDVGGVLTQGNDIYLYTNYRSTFGNSNFTDIARFECSNPNDVSDLTNEEWKWNIFPNPNDGIFRLTIDSGELQCGRVEIYNLLGESVFYSGDICFSDTVFNLGFLEKGIYLIRINSQEKSYIGKVVVQK